jgi:hypothetical protein
MARSAHHVADPHQPMSADVADQLKVQVAAPAFADLNNPALGIDPHHLCKTRPPDFSPHQPGLVLLFPISPDLRASSPVPLRTSRPAVLT